jgi:hypothetical protein
MDDNRKLGRIILPPDDPSLVNRLALAPYMADLPAAPDHCDWTAGITAWGMIGNDQYGDCGPAAWEHGLMSKLAAAMGKPTTPPTTAETLQFYHAVSGPGDNGVDNSTMLKTAQRVGCHCGGTLYKAGPYASIKATDHETIKKAIWYLGGCLVGCNLPGDWYNNFGPGKVWDKTNSAIEGGHDIWCFSGETQVSLLDGTERTIKELAEGAAGKEFWVYSCDPSGNVVPGKATAQKTGFRKIIKVTLDNGESIRCTPDHRFMLRDGSYKEAGQLAIGESLMPLYRKLSATKSMNGYEKVYNPATKKWRFTHRVVCTGGLYKGDVVHHRDFNKRNNSPDNLEVLSWDSHTRLHMTETVKLQGYAKSEEGRAKSRELMNRLWADPEWRARMVKQLGQNGSTACKRRAAEGVCGFQAQNKDDLAEWVRKSNAARKGFRHSSASIAKMSAARKLLMQDPIRRAKQVGYCQKATAAFVEKHRATTANNHKVVKVEPDGEAAVYDLTVAAYHNFALSAGVFVHNCYAYNDKGIFIVTWAQGGTLVTWAGLEQNCDEIVAVAEQDCWIPAGKTRTPNGVTLQQWLADAALLGAK